MAFRLLRRAAGYGLLGSVAVTVPVAYVYRPRSLREHTDPETGELLTFPYQTVDEDNLLVRISQGTVIGSVALASKLWLQVLNRSEFFHHGRLMGHLRNRDRRPLLTVSNHVSIFDDPGLTAAMVPLDIALRPSAMRWGYCAEDVCYDIGVAAQSFFGAGKVLPATRGAGVDQPSLSLLSHKLNRYRWVHVYPEGRTWQESGHPPRRADGRLCLPGSDRCGPVGARLGPLKWGVGKLIAESETTPIVLPMFHTGMERVLPQEATNNDLLYSVPRVGQRICVLFGREVEVTDLVREYRRWRRSASPRGFDAYNPHSLATESSEHRRVRQDFYRRITERVAESLLNLDADMRVIVGTARADQ